MSDSNTIRVALIQHACPKGKGCEAILAQFSEMARDAKRRGAQVIATQELFASHYFCQIEDSSLMDLAEPIPGPTTEYLANLARELDVEITASLFERRVPGVYHNTSVYLSRTGELLGKYRKMHIPDDPRFYEKFYFTPGDLGWQVIPGAMRSGLLVCWDQWYPEAARATALLGAQIIYYPTAIGWWHGETDADRKAQREAWITMHRSHAIANGVWVAAINRVGREDDLTFWGSSMMISPAGEIVAEAAMDSPAVLVVDCDLSLIESARRGWPFFRDRRIDAYGGLCRRFLDGNA